MPSQRSHGMGAPLRLVRMGLVLHNTLTRREEAVAPLEPGLVRFYSCGPTVYDDAHIGNFRTFLAADVLRRWLESAWCEVVGPDGREVAGPRVVRHVMNITDVGHMTDDAEGGEAGEDRMAVAGRRLAEAKKAGMLPAGVEVDPGDPYAIARFYEGRFLEDARALGLKVSLEREGDASLMPRATESVAGMIAVIRRLLDGGHAYVVGEPSRRAVYFRVRSFEPYGRLSGNTLEHLREGAGGRIAGEHQAQKEHPADFLLWKEDPSHLMRWPSPWGVGYPGWHIECSVMSLSARGGSIDPATLRLSDGEAIIDIHSGGEDNIFPHHECELAQSCCAFNEAPDLGTFARVWFHARHLLVEGEKMAKSKGNFFTARDLFARGVEPAALRLELIRTHYRTNANFTMQGLTDSQRMVDRWRRFVELGSRKHDEGDPGLREAARREIVAAMNADLNVSGSIGALNSWMSRVETPGRGDAAMVMEFDRVLGILERERPRAAETDIGVFAPGVTPDPAVISLLVQRRDARAAKNFARSDEIRDELAAMGYAIKDLSGGRVEVRRA